jgi:hypothetical protein
MKRIKILSTIYEHFPISQTSSFSTLPSQQLNSISHNLSNDLLLFFNKDHKIQNKIYNTNIIFKTTDPTFVITKSKNTYLLLLKSMKYILNVNFKHVHLHIVTINQTVEKNNEKLVIRFAFLIIIIG